MNNKKIHKILVACHSAAATSAYTSEKVKDLLNKYKEKADIRICTLRELSGYIDSFKPDLVLTTSSIESHLNIPPNTPILSALPLMMGIGEEEVNLKILEILKIG